MNELEQSQHLSRTWEQGLQGELAPCGPDLEYDNEFLELNQACAGKPESQFGPAEPPNWVAVRATAESLMMRTLDLRVAIAWLRAGLHLQGYGFLPLGLALLNGLIQAHGEHLHPLPDPDDGDPYARLNALQLLCASEGIVGDLRETLLLNDRAIGQIRGRQVELAFGLAPALAEESPPSRERLGQMLADALEKQPALREQCLTAQSELQRLGETLDAWLGTHQTPDLKPLKQWVQAVVHLLPASSDAGQGASDASPAGGGEGEGERGGTRAALTGAVNSREEALRAIQLVCEYLERAEPSNPAPLFLRRAAQLINHDFLQLIKTLAPDALSSVAHLVGVDPDKVVTPEDASS